MGYHWLLKRKAYTFFLSFKFQEAEAAFLEAYKLGQEITNENIVN